jgi:hypothetical protein
VTEVDAQLQREWLRARRKLIRSLPKEQRDRFDALVLDLLRLNWQATTPPPPSDRRPYEGRLRMGAEVAAALRPHAPDDIELLAAVATLPWFRTAPWPSRQGLLLAPGPLDWPRAMLLAMSAGGLRGAGRGLGERQRYLGALAALPPLLRVAVLRQLHLAATMREFAKVIGTQADPLDATELAGLAAGVPPELIPPAAAPRPPQEPPAAPVAGPDAAINRVRSRPNQRINGFNVVVDRPYDYVVEGRELYYVVRWDVPPEAIRTLGPPVTNPGDHGVPTPLRQPGWLVDRVTGDIDTVDLATDQVDAQVRAIRNYPLPPGWRPGPRPSLPDGFGHELAGGLPTPLPPLLGAVVAEAVARYATRLSTPWWPDFLVACRVGARAMHALRGAGVADPTILGAALLIARGPGPEDTLTAPDSPAWAGPAGQLARAATAGPQETYGPGLELRLIRLIGAPQPVRALVIADAWARATVDGELLGAVPGSNGLELSRLRPLTEDLPDPLSRLWYLPS